MNNRILLVDDEEAILLSFTRLLSHASFHVDTARRIEDAEALLKENQYAVVITDLRLTGVLGEEGLEILRYAHEKNPGAAVILVTGYGNPEIMNRAFELDAAFYFEKPVEPKQLLEAVRELCSGSRKPAEVGRELGN
ncbi:MAG: response regulator [Thermoanaerobaculia bacterium]